MSKLMAWFPSDTGFVTARMDENGNVVPVDPPVAGKDWREYAKKNGYAMGELTTKASQ